MADWANEPFTGAVGNGSASSSSNDVADRTAMIAARLKSIYKKSVLPVEKRHRYDYFYESPFLTDVEFDAKPQVMLIGQYSVGKTSFIR